MNGPEDGYPVVSAIASADLAPPVAGLDNAKLKVFDDYKGVVAKVEKRRRTRRRDGKPRPTAHDHPGSRPQADTLKKEKDAGKPGG